MSFAMTKQEREAFLADVHVGVLSVPSRAAGRSRCRSGTATSRAESCGWSQAGTRARGGCSRRAGRMSLCAQTETAPYKYVSVEGPIVAIEPAEIERDLRPLARRYLGREGGDQYVESTRSEHGDNVLVRMRPERWLTVDFAKG